MFAQLSLARTLLSLQRPDPIRASVVAHQVLEVASAVASNRIREEFFQPNRMDELLRPRLLRRVRAELASLAARSGPIYLQNGDKVSH